MIYRLAVLASVTALVGCGGSPFENPTVRDAKRVVSEQLIDGSSAKFENVVAQKTTIENAGPMRPLQDVEKAACGWVNAKNRMGAFAGAERFLVKDGYPTFRDGDEAAWENAFGMCVIHSGNQEATDRLTREGKRAMQAYSNAVDEMLAQR